MRKNPQGFTLLELLVVVVIIGVLASLGLANFAQPKELAIEKEALTNLKLIASAEKIYRMESTSYIGLATTTDINTELRLMLPASDPNWSYKVVDAAANTFTAKALRTSGPYTGSKVFCITQAQDKPDTSGCSW
jgi:prepilin-type N-terminal cleavage/methylation domain-containing protein